VILFQRSHHHSSKDIWEDVYLASIQEVKSVAARPPIDEAKPVYPSYLFPTLHVAEHSLSLQAIVEVEVKPGSGERSRNTILLPPSLLRQQSHSESWEQLAGMIVSSELSLQYHPRGDLQFFFHVYGSSDRSNSSLLCSQAVLPLNADSVATMLAQPVLHIKVVVMPSEKTLISLSSSSSSSSNPSKDEAATASAHLVIGRPNASNSSASSGSSSNSSSSQSDDSAISKWDANPLRSKAKSFISLNNNHAGFIFSLYFVRNLHQHR